MNIYNIEKDVETFNYSTVEAEDAFKTYKILERFNYASNSEIEKTIAMIDFCNKEGFNYESK
jgi:hypothetical protein